MNKIKWIKALIYILLIFIIGTLIIIVYLKKSNQNNEEKVENFDSGFEYEENDNGFQMLNDASTFFSIMDSLSRYLQVVSYNDESELSLEENIYNISSEDEKNEILESMLDEDYQKNNEKNIGFNEIEYNSIRPNQIKVKYDTPIITYIVDVYLENSIEKSLNEKFFIIRLDTDNSTFSIEPVDENIDNIDNIKVEQKTNNIPSNMYNKYNLESISIERLVKTYMDNFTYLEVNYPEFVYDEILGEEYKEARFESKDEFVKYVSNNKDEINEIRATNYLIEEDDDNHITKYVVLDQYKNTYTFSEIATMKYTVILDTYTIMTDKFKTTYDESGNNKKVMMNTDKWIQMINSRDYKTAYSYLDETFANNNFGSEEAFEEYMREKFPLHYQLEMGESTETNGTYTQEITLTDITEESDDVIENTIIMKLLDDYDFVMSFEIK